MTKQVANLELQPVLEFPPVLLFIRDSTIWLMISSPFTAEGKPLKEADRMSGEENLFSWPRKMKKPGKLRVIAYQAMASALVRKMVLLSPWL